MYAVMINFHAQKIVSEVFLKKLTAWICNIGERFHRAQKTKNIFGNTFYSRNLFSYEVDGRGRYPLFQNVQIVFIAYFVF